MKTSRVLFLLLSLILSLCTATSANAENRVADCLELKFPTATTTATVFTLSVKVYATCNAEQLGRGEGQKALFSMPDEESLFNLSSCTGPTAQARFGLSDGFLGTATCSLRVGSNTLPSPRIGATSTTIKMWFAWDFSTKYVSVSHPAIPGRTSSGSGGSSGGTVSPIKKTCISAPETPTLLIEWNEKGPLFRFSLSNSDPNETDIYFHYTLYDTSKSAWGSWTPWKKIGSGNFGEYQAFPELNKTRIAFSVYAVNTCGSSGDARESVTRTGVPLTPLIQDELVSNLDDFNRIEVGELLNVNEFATSRLSLSISAKSITSSVCEITGTGEAKMLSPGECKLEITSKTAQEKSGSPAQIFSFEVKPNRKSQEIPDIDLNASYTISTGSITLNAITDKGLEVSFESMSDRICYFNGKKLIFRAQGKCEISATQDGDEDTLPAEMRYFSLQITVAKTSIVCSKGKQTKRVTGINPKCPTGYKIKK